MKFLLSLNDIGTRLLGDETVFNNQLTRIHMNNVCRRGEQVD